MIEITQFRTVDRDAWRDALQRFRPNDDIYFQPEYAMACEANGDGEAFALLATEDSSALFVCALKCAIPGQAGLYDMQGPYGYGGPLAVNPSAEFLERAWRLIADAWKSTGAVAVFLRCHPLLANGHLFSPDWSVVYDRHTVSADLRAGAVAAFDGPSARKHRRDSAQARRAGLSARFQALDDAGIIRFRRLYEGTMSRLGAGEEYFFSQAYFETLARDFSNSISLVEVGASGDDEPLSAALIFWGFQWAHYHLSGRQAVDRNASHLLLQAVAEEAAKRGLAALHLGGGRTRSPDDSLLRFKKWVGGVEHSFHTARLVVDSARYNELVSAWRSEHTRCDPLLFLTYRQNPAPALN